MPYGYYTLSRFVVCACSIYFMHRIYLKNQTSFVWVFGFLALLYNPIIPVHLYQKEIWMVVNAITAVLFFVKKGDALREEVD